MSEHVDELLSGYLDGELTQQDAQRVAVHLADCDACRALQNDLVALKARVGEAGIEGKGASAWRESTNDPAIRVSLGVGWVLLIGAVLLAGGYGVYQFLSAGPGITLEKVIVGGIYLGLAGLFVGVLRQRLIERKNDKYDKVEI